jgi:hypothetical protein
MRAGFKQHRTTIRQHLRKGGVDTRPPAIPDKDVAWDVKLYKTGWSLAKIAERYGVSPHAVYDRFTTAGVKLRPRAGSRPKGTR